MKIFHVVILLDDRTIEHTVSSNTLEEAIRLLSLEEYEYWFFDLSKGVAGRELLPEEYEKYNCSATDFAKIFSTQTTFDEDASE